VDPHTCGVERLPPPADLNNQRFVAVHLRIELGAVFGEGVLDFLASHTIFLFELCNRERPRRQLGYLFLGLRSLSRRISWRGCRGCYRRISRASAKYVSNTCSIELMKSNRILNERIMTVRRIFGEPYSNKNPNMWP